MYDLVAGDGHQRSRGDILLEVLGNPDPGRFRDAWVEVDPEGGNPIIAIYTRNGGGNRECWCDDGDHEQYGPCTALKGEALTAHPLYIRDVDDDFDATYATYYFRAPEEYAEMLRDVAQEHVDTSQRWLDLIAALGAAR